jgi:beta-lactamase class A
VDIYVLDLQTQETVHFASQGGQNISINPDIAFSGASTIKIPIMVSVFRHFNSNITPDTDALLTEMFQSLTGNGAADSLMSSIDAGRGPLIVTDTLQKLGMDNTFIAMYFAPGSIALNHFNTLSNTRADISTNPDTFNQTTPSEMGILLEDIYLCAQTGGGSLVAAFPGQINQEACQQMIQYMVKDKFGALIQGGVPEGTIVAHKHGFTLNDFSDAGLIYTPGGNYILTIYLYHPVQAIWDIVSPLFAEISRAVYNFFNLPSK